MRLIPKLERIDVLLRAGYFPHELPPVFTTKDFADHYPKLRRSWNRLQRAEALKASNFYKYSIPKGSLSRRVLALVNPVHQSNLVEEIANNIKEINNHILKSNNSSFKLGLTVDQKLPEDNHNIRHTQSQRSLAFSTKSFESDILRFYPSLYTHAIPWALHGKAVAKSKQRDTSLLGNRLDALIRKCQDNQSIGLPIGPVTSRIIAEIVATSIDIKLRQELKDHKVAFNRHVDDVIISQPDSASEYLVRQSWSRSLSKYELSSNEQKSKFILPGGALERDWVRLLRSIEVPNYRQTRRHIDEYFTLSFKLSDDYPDEGVLSWAIKKAQSFIIHDDFWPLFEHYLFQVAWRDGKAAQPAMHIIAQGAAHSAPVNKTEVLDFCTKYINHHHLAGNEYESIWALFLMRSLPGITVSSKSISAVLESAPTISSLVALDMRASGKTRFKTPKLWIDTAKNGDLNSSDWLFIYECARKGWIPEAIPTVKQHKYFKSLLKSGVYFYDEKRNFRNMLRLLRERLARFQHSNAFDFRYD